MINEENLTPEQFNAMKERMKQGKVEAEKENEKIAINWNNNNPKSPYILRKKDEARNSKIAWTIAIFLFIIVFGYFSYQGAYKSNMETSFSPNITMFCREQICNNLPNNCSCINNCVIPSKIKLEIINSS